jgi:hypothetical protein
MTEFETDEIGDYELFIDYNHATGEAELTWRTYVGNTIILETWVRATTGETFFVSDNPRASGTTSRFLC